MGPRSLDRGEAAGSMWAVNKLFELQWGRGLWTAERRNGDVALYHLVKASMGPRSLDRGERIAERWDLLPGYASMGPRSLDRGEAADELASYAPD